MAEEAALFDFSDVVETVTEKMIRRHPRVFGGAAGIDSAHAQTLAWEEHKRRERAAKPAAAGVLDDVPRALPALLRAEKLQRRAASVGFDWESAAKVVEKIAEEAQEIVDAQREGASTERLEDEVGDLLFCVANLARHLKIDPEKALSATNAKFIRRFKAIEAGLAAQGRSPTEATLDEMEALWQSAKRAEG
jgi:ATP diphosphatase